MSNIRAIPNRLKDTASRRQFFRQICAAPLLSARAGAHYLPRLTTAAVLTAQLGCAAIPLAYRAGGVFSPPLFRASHSDGRRLDLFGTLHSGMAEFFPLPLAVENAFQQAQVLAIEIDAPRHWNALVSAFRPYVRLAAGRSLSELFPASVLAEFRRYFGFSEPVWRDMQTMQPWWIANFRMSTDRDRRTAVSEVFGAEPHLLARARQDHKTVIELEQIHEQVLGLAGGDLDEQVAQLLAWFEEIKQRSGLVSDLLSAWQRGDLDAMAELKSRTWGDEQRLTSLRRRVFTERDQRIALRLAQASVPKISVFAAVGAFHLVGQDSVLQALARSGFRIERIDTATRYDRGFL